MKTKALFLLLLLSLGTGFADTKKPSPPMRTGTIKFAGRTCFNCKYSLRQGYLSKVVSPDDGAWDISSEGIAVINELGVVSIDPKLSGGGVSDVIQQSIRTRALLNQRMSRY